MSSQHVNPEILTGYLAGELSAKDRHDADTHFSVCPVCAAKLEEQREFENTIVHTYPGNFPDHLSHEARLAVNDEIKAGFQPDTAAPVKWESRIRRKLLVQAASVVFVAAILCTMLLFEVNTDYEKEQTNRLSEEKQPVPEAMSAPTPASVVMETAEKQQIPEDMPAPNPAPAVMETAEKQQIPEDMPAPNPAPVVMETEKAKRNSGMYAARSLPSASGFDGASLDASAAAEVKKEAFVRAENNVKMDQADADTVTAARSLRNIAQNEGLIKLLRVGEVTLETKSEPPKNSRYSLTIQNVRSPFSENTFVVYAEAVSKIGKAPELHIMPDPSVRNSPLQTKDGPGVRTVVFDGAELSEFGKIEILTSDSLPDKMIRLPIHGEASAIEFSQAIPRARLAVILHAASNPYLVLNREVRAKILAELDRLIATDYADNFEIKALYERIKRIK